MPETTFRIASARVAALPFEPSCVPEGGYSLLYFFSACRLVCRNEAIPMRPRICAVLCSGTEFSLEGRDGQVFELVLAPASRGSIQWDAGSAMAGYPSIAELFSQVDPYFACSDAEHVYVILFNILQELQADGPEQRAVLSSLLLLLFIKLSRNIAIHNSTNSIDTVARAQRYIAEHLSEPIRIRSIADDLGISSACLQSLFAKYKRRTIGSYIRHVRIDDAAMRLITTSDPVEDIARSCGFGNRQTFARCFRKQMLMTPREYRKIFSFEDLNGTAYSRKEG